MSANPVSSLKFKFGNKAAVLLTFQNKKMNREVLQEKQKSQQFEALIQRYAPTYMKPSASQACGGDVPREPWRTPHVGLVQDGPRSLKADSASSDSQSKPAKGASHGRFECKKCQKTNFKDEKHYEEHCKLCMQ